MDQKDHTKQNHKITNQIFDCGGSYGYNNFDIVFASVVCNYLGKRIVLGSKVTLNCVRRISNPRHTVCVFLVV